MRLDTIHPDAVQQGVSGWAVVRLGLGHSSAHRLALSSIGGGLSLLFSLGRRGVRHDLWCC